MIAGERAGFNISHSLTINGARLTNLTMLPVTMSKIFRVDTNGFLILNVRVITCELILKEVSIMDEVFDSTRNLKLFEAESPTEVTLRNFTMKNSSNIYFTSRVGTINLESLIFENLTYTNFSAIYFDDPRNFNFRHGYFKYNYFS